MEKNKRIQNKIIRLQNMVESILFLEGKYISLKMLAQKAQGSEDDVKKCIKDINTLYVKNKHVFVIVESDNSYMITIKKDFANKLYTLYKPRGKQKLSRALLETLSIIAYSQPITRVEIQSIRGVNSESALKILLEQELVKVIGKKQVPGTPNEYGTSPDFLRTFGLASIKDLPKLQGHLEQPFI